MPKKEFSYRGKSLEQLQALSLQDFAKLTVSRVRRSLLRGLDKPLDKAVNIAVKDLLAGKKPKTVRTHKRDTIITPKMAGLQFAIYKGNGFEFVDIKPEMVGHFLGEFAQTRKAVRHGKAGIGATKSSTAIATRK
ncbi:MAG: 30S ribosomal protein S19 [Candidatus Diapherotrites archaeon]|nr:30S ribosomal protein S19 [Candidatus Diapherotrites archaeon]